jgi:hypothetical protein
MLRRVAPSMLLIVVLVGVGPTAPTATATAHRLVYRCRLIATKLGEEITVTYRLRTDRARDEWRVRLYHEGDLIYSKVRSTNADGNLKVVRVVENMPARDDLVGRARHLGTDRICEVASRI